MSKLFGRVEKLEERTIAPEEHRADAEWVAKSLAGLAARLPESDVDIADEHRASWSPARQVAWRMRFLDETVAQATAPFVPGGYQ